MRFWGRIGPAPPRGLPRAAALQKGGCPRDVRKHLRMCRYVDCNAVSLFYLVLVCYVFLGRKWAWATMFLGFRSSFVRYDARFCATGGGSRGGGVLGPLGTTVFPGCLPRRSSAAHGPASLQCEVLRDLLVCIWFLLGFSGMDVGYSVWFFGLWGWNDVWFGAL